MSKPRKHHYLSQFYLKGFSFEKDNSDKCFMYNIPNDTNIVEASVVDIAAEKDLFTIESWAGKEFSLEEDFGKKEIELAKYLKSVLNIIEWDWKISNAEEEKIIDLILFQYKRSLIVSSQVKQRMEKEIEEITRDVKKEYPDADLSDIDMKKMSKTEMNKQLKSWYFDQVMWKYPIKEKLLNRNWYFYQITDYNKSFVTSDMPLYRYNKIWESNWIENSSTQIIFPLSSKIVLLIHWEWKQRQKEVKNDNEFIKRVNGMVITNASNFIIWSSDKLLEKLKKQKKWNIKKYLYPENAFLLNISKI